MSSKKYCYHSFPQIYFHGKKAELATWIPILDKAGCDRVSRFPTNIQHAMDSDLPFQCHAIVVGGTMLPSGISNRAKILNIPIVNQDWLIQCLIHGAFVPPNSSEHWRYISRKR